MRNGWFVWCNFFCLFAVVHQHLPHEENPYWVASLILLVIPIFSVIAGCSWGVLLKKTGGNGLFGGLRFFVYPYLFWLVFYYLYKYVLVDVFVRHQSYQLPSAFEVARWLVYGQTYGALYYIVSLIYLMLITIVFYKWCVNKKIFYGSATIAALITLALKSFVSVEIIAQIHLPLSLICVLFCSVAPYFLIGVVFSAWRSEKFKNYYVRRLLPFFWILGIALHLRGDDGMNFWMTAPLVCTILMTMLAFPTVYVPFWIKASAPYIMGIYLIHGVLTTGAGILLSYVGCARFVMPYDWLLSVVLVFMAWGIVWSMRKVPLLRMVV